MSTQDDSKKVEVGMRFFDWFSPRAKAARDAARQSEVERLRRREEERRRPLAASAGASNDSFDNPMANPLHPLNPLNPLYAGNLSPAPAVERCDSGSYSPSYDAGTCSSPSYDSSSSSSSDSGSSFSSSDGGSSW